MEMKRNSRTPFSDRCVYESSSSESEELHRPEKKLRLKVKIPVKPTKPNEEENPNPPPSPPPPLTRRRHFCEVCNKEFSSGKAFGGHVRIHSIEYKSKMKNKNKNKMVMKKNKRKKKSVVKKKMEEERDDLMIRADVEEVGGEIKCCLCGKVFQTKHSLFGHMRRHPDRSWKGIRPPPSPENEFSRRITSVTGSSSSSEKFKISSCSSDLDDDVDDDDDEYDDVFDDNDDVMSSSKMDVQEAAYCLMMLSCSRSNYRRAKSSGFGGESGSGDAKKAKSEVRKSCLYEGKGKEKVSNDEPKGGDQIGSSVDHKGLIVDMKIKMEIEVTMNPRDDHLQDRARACGDSDKKILGFDLNQPYVGEDEEHGSDWLQI